jgi:peptide/nickel transport system permease protein
MRAYIIRRLILMIPTLFLVTVIIFGLIRFIPGDVIDLMMAEFATVGVLAGQGEQITQDFLKQSLGLDVPIHVQYARWLGIAPPFDGIFQGNLGTSLWRNEPVAWEIVKRIPVSLELGIVAIITAISLAIPIGIYSAIRQDTMGDYTGRTVAILAISLPNFWLGTILIIYASIYLRWAPSMEYVPIVRNLGENLVQFIVPGVIMGMVMSGTTMRMTRTMMLEVLRQDYIRTAWSKGLRERTVIMRHALKNALIPVVSMIGLLIPIVIGGSVVMETVFALPGIGLLLIDALRTRDYPVVSAINVILAGAVLIVNLLVDLTYAWLDPRVQYR